MGSRYEVEITITSAKDLKNVNWRHGKLRPYAVAWVDSSSKCSTRVDEEGDDSPTWNHKLVIPFNSSIEESTLYIDIVHANDSGEDTKPLVGSAKLPLAEVVQEVGLGNLSDRKLKIKRPSGRPHGKVEVNVCVRDPRYQAPQQYGYGAPPPVTRDYPPAQQYGYQPAPAAYEAQPYGSGGGYGSQQPAYAPYGSGGGYGSQPPAYGSQPPQGYEQGGYQGGEGHQGYGEEKEKKSKFGGMGTGLAVGAVAGVLGGIALSQGFDALTDNIAEDAADKVEEEREEEEEEEEEEREKREEEREEREEEEEEEEEERERREEEREEEEEENYGSD